MVELADHSQVALRSGSAAHLDHAQGLVPFPSLVLHFRAAVRRCRPVWTLSRTIHDVHFDKDWFFTFGNLALLFVSIILLKIVHEFGHGVTCKHFGGEVHEIGFMIMILTPMFYVNTSDTWLFPNKKHRMYVSAAGVYVELIFAAVLVYVWLFLAPDSGSNLPSAPSSPPASPRSCSTPIR